MCTTLVGVTCVGDDAVSRKAKWALTLRRLSLLRRYSQQQKSVPIAVGAVCLLMSSVSLITQFLLLSSLADVGCIADIEVLAVVRLLVQYRRSMVSQSYRCLLVDAELTADIALLVALYLCSF